MLSWYRRCYRDSKVHRCQGILSLDDTLLDTLVEAAFLNPLGRVPRSDVFRVEELDILKRKTFGLWDHQVDIDKGEAENTTEDEHDEGTQLRSDLVRKVREQKVPDPVTCRSERDSLGTSGRVEGFREVQPRTWTPTAAVKEEVDDGKGDEDGASLTLRVGDLVGRCTFGRGLVVSDKGDDEGASSFSGSTDEEQGSTTKLFDGDQGWDGSDEGGGTKDELNLEGVERKCKGGAKKGKVVVVEVLTVELLEGLKHHAVESTLPHLVL